MVKLFGTDGIRSRANKFPMDAESVLKIAKLCALRFKDQGNSVLIGKDTRRSCYVFESCFVAGLLSFGMDVMLVGPIPTPAISVLTKSLRCAFGVMISASHNEFCDNGIKFFDKNGLKLLKDDEAFIENGFDQNINTNCQNFGKAERLSDALGRYIEYVKKSFPQDTSLKGVKIALDCANGSGYKVAQKILWELGAELVVINDRPDGYNINLNCGALYPESLGQTVVKEKADIGIALDGDADRLVVCDENGSVVDGDQLIATIAVLLLNQKKLSDNTVVITEASSLALERFLLALGINVVKTEVGDKNVLNALRSSNSNFGAEPSGHIIMTDYVHSSDALVAALQILYLMVMQKKTASKILKNFSLTPKIQVSISEAQKIEDKKIEDAKNYAKNYLNDDEKILIRRSGTEDKIRIMAESHDASKVKELIGQIYRMIKN